VIQIEQGETRDAAAARVAREYPCTTQFVREVWQEGMTEREVRFVLDAFAPVGLWDWLEVRQWAAVTGRTPEGFIRAFASVVEEEAE
jgi:hypothetical protein